jgi:hypothetical protein
MEDQDLEDEDLDSRLLRELNTANPLTDNVTNKKKMTVFWDGLPCCLVITTKVLEECTISIIRAEE